MSFSCHSEPKRTSTAKGTNGRPRLSRVFVDSVTRTRRSRGGGRAREKRLLSCRASGFTSPCSTRLRAHSTSDGSSAEASDGTDDRTNTHKSQRRNFTADPSNGLNGVGYRENGSRRNELDDGSACKDRPPQRDHVGEIGVDSHGVETDDQRARDDRNTHLAHDVPHRAAVRDEIASSRSQDPTYRAPCNDRGGKEKPRGHDFASFRIEREHDARRDEGEENESAGEPSEPAVPRRSPLEPSRHEQEAKRERERRARDVKPEGGEPKGLESDRELLDDEGRKRLEVEVREARRRDESRADQHHDQEEPRWKIGEETRHVSLNGWGRQKLCSFVPAAPRGSPGRGSRRDRKPCGSKPDGRPGAPVSWVTCSHPHQREPHRIELGERPRGVRSFLVQ